MDEIDRLKILSEQKESDWKLVVQKRVEMLEKDSVAKTEKIDDCEEKMKKLKEDFKYNLRLLQERDDDLHRYEKMLTDLKGELNARVADLSDTRIRLDEAQVSINHQEVCQRDLHKNYQQRLREKEEQYHNLISTREAQMKVDRTQFETTKQDLDQRLNVARSELDLQKRELLQGFDDAMVTREHEYKLSMDDLSTKCLEHDLKNQLLMKEMEMLQASRVKDSKYLQHTESTRKTVERQLKETQWEITDVKNTTEFRVKEMEEELLRIKSQNQKLLTDYNKKHAEANRGLTEKDATIERLKAAFTAKEQKLSDQIREISEKLEDADVKGRQLLWANEDLTKEKAILAEKFQSEVDDLKTEWGRQIKEVGQTNVERDLELENLRARVGKLNDELIMRKQDIDRYKKDISSAIDRETELERKLTQTEVEWRRKYEDAERIEYGKSEGLVERVSVARDQAVAMVKEKDRLLKERDAVIAALRGGVPASQITIPSQTEMEELCQQNEGLRKVVSEMRAQMEGMSLDHKGDNQGVSSDLFHKSDKTDVNATDNPVLSSHLKSLNNLIGTLRSEKLELVAQIKKQQVRIEYLSSQLDSIAKQPREKQVEVDQLRYELSALTRRSQAETESLRQRVRELEMEVREATKEAEQYHRANLEKNATLTALENQLSTYKLDMARKVQPVNFGAQELLISQLQEEITSLKSRRPPDSQDVSSVEHLREKLRIAARHVIQLSRDKQQLIELGNKLRSQLSCKEMQPHTLDKHISADYCSNTNPYNDPHTKLSAMETLQYHLTKQELQFAHLSPERGPSKDSDKLSRKVNNIASQDSTDLDVMQSLSSTGLEGLNDVWQILDQSGPSALGTSHSFTASKEGPIIHKSQSAKASTNQKLEISGNKAVLKSQSRPQSSGQQATNKATKKAKPKVRNYNVTKDTSLR